MGDEFGGEPRQRSNLRVVRNLDLDPATAEAKRRLLKPEPRPRSSHEPMVIAFLLTVAVATMVVGYLGGRNNALFATAETADGETAGAPVAATLTTELPVPEPPTAASPTSSAPSTTLALAPVEPPSLADTFDDSFSGSAAPAARPIPTTTQLPANEESVVRSSELAVGIAKALGGLDPDEPILASGTSVDLRNVDDSRALSESIDATDLRLPDTAAAESTAEFIALTTDIFGPGLPSVVALDDDGDAFEIDGGIRFGYKSSTIDDAYLPFLDRLVTLLQQRPNLTLAVIGHTDSRGDAAKNRKLATARSESVVAYLQFSGVDPERLSAVGVGADQPVASNDTEAGRELNRRIQLALDRLIN